MTLLLLVLALAQEPVVIRTTEGSVPAFEPAAGEIGVALGVPAESAEAMKAGGFASAPFVRGKIAFVVDPKAPPAGAETVVWVATGTREQAAAVLRESKGITLCIVTGRGGGDPEPLRIGDAWMVQAPGPGGLWGRIELRGGTCTNRFSLPEGKARAGAPADPVATLRGSSKAGASAASRSLETANRACRLSIRSLSERAAYGPKTAAPGRKLLVIDAELENIIPMTLIQSNSVPTMYKIKELGDHLYLVVNGIRVSRLFADAGQLPGHVTTSGFSLDRLGSQARGNLVFEIPAEGVETLDLRFYDYAHGHMALTLKDGARPESKPVGALQSNEILEAGLYRFERLRDFAGKKAPEGMSFLTVELRARSMMSTESDATAFDPKAKPGDKIQVGTVSDWKESRKHLNALVDGEYAYASLEGMELGEAPRFIPDLLTGGSTAFLIPEKAQSVEIRCDFPNAKLPDGRVTHPKALLFVVEGKRPEPAAAAPILEIDDEVFKVAVTGQSTAAEFAGAKAPGGSVFLVLDVRVTGAGTAGDVFQTSEQLHYATEKGVQLPLHDVTWKGPRAPSKLHLVPTNERRSFQAVFAIPATDKRPRLAYRGVSKAAIVALKPIEDAAAARACPKCKRPAEANEKFCAECGTPIGK